MKKIKTATVSDLLDSDKHKDGDSVFGYIRVVWEDKDTTVETKNLIVNPDGTVEDLNAYQWEERLGR